MGYPGNYNKKQVKDILDEIESITLNSKKSLGFHVIESDHNKVLDKIQKGYNFLAFSIDFFFLGDLARNEMKQIKKKYKRICNEKN